VPPRSATTTPGGSLPSPTRSPAPPRRSPTTPPVGSPPWASERANATRTYDYDDLGRIDTDTWRRPDTTVAASVDYTYDNDDLLIGKTTTGVAGAGTNAYAYDGLDRLTSWTSPSSAITSYGYWL
jgi:YD repeat-containing protein